MKDVVVPIIVAMIGVLFGGGSVPLVKAVLGKGKARVDEVAALGEASEKWVDRFERKAHEALDEAERARVELRQVRAEVFALAQELHRIRMLVMRDPPPSIEEVRQAVGGQE